MNVYEYVDYRKYLKDFYDEQKRKSSSYSYRVFANRAKLVSPNYLKLVIDGKRRITDRTIHQFARGLGLPKQQAQYFKSLVMYQEAGDADAKNAHLNEMIRFKRRALNQAQIVTQDRYEIFRRWHHLAICEMVLLKDFKPDSVWISARLGGKITPREAQESLELLERLQFIRKEGGKYAVSQPMLSTPDEISSLLIRELHRQHLELGIDSIFNDPMEEREISGLTISIPKSKIPEIKQAIKAFRRELNQTLAQTEDNEEVYHLVMELFPLTKKRSRA